jgi:hypothetical protein
MIGSPEYDLKIDQMIENVIENCPQFLGPQLCKRLRSSWAARGIDLRRFLAEIPRPRTSVQKTTFLLGRILTGSLAAWEFGRLRLRKERPPDDWPHNFVKRWLKDICSGPILEPL